MSNPPTGQSLPDENNSENKENEALSRISFPGDSVWAATKRGDLEVVKKFVERDGVPDVLDDYYRDVESLLTVACKSGHVEVVRCLLELEKARYSSSWYVPEAFAALEAGHLDVLELLCEFGLDASDSRTKYGESLLWTAVRGRQFDAVRLLARHGADMTPYIYDEEMTEEERTSEDAPEPLEIELAARAGDVEYVQVLLEIGVDLGDKSADDYLILAHGNHLKWQRKQEIAQKEIQAFNHRKKQQEFTQLDLGINDEFSWITAIFVWILFVVAFFCGALIWWPYVGLRHLWNWLGASVFIVLCVTIIVLLWAMLKV